MLYDGDEGGRQGPDNADNNASAPMPCLAFDSGRAFWWSERVREAGALALRADGEVLRETGWQRMQQSDDWRWDPALVRRRNWQAKLSEAQAQLPRERREGVSPSMSVLLKAKPAGVHANGFMFRCAAGSLIELKCTSLFLHDAVAWQ